MHQCQDYALDPGFKALLSSVGVRHEDVLRVAGLPEGLSNRSSTRVNTDAMPAERGAFEAFLGCEIRKGSQLRISFTAQDTARPSLTHNGSMWELFEPQLRLRLSTPH